MIEPQGALRLLSLRLRRVGRRYGRHRALRGVSLELRAGEVALLLGHNGAGKTTLMRLLSGLLRPSEGQLVARLEVGGEAREVDFYDLFEQRPDLIGLVSHASLLYEDLTGEENLVLFSRLYGLSEQEAKARAQALLGLMGMEKAAQRPVAGYSRGMKQRLSLARALVQRPSLVLFDEPFTGLDQAGQRVVCEVLEKLRAAGCVVVMITHDLGLPPSLLDRAILLEDGEVRQEGRPGAEGLAVWYERALLEGQGRGDGAGSP